MNRQRAIDIIKETYPANSEFAETAKIGQELLEQAKRELMDWEQEPDEVLIHYAHLCLDRMMKGIKD